MNLFSKMKKSNVVVFLTKNNHENPNSTISQSEKEKSQYMEHSELSICTLRVYRVYKVYNVHWSQSICTQCHSAVHSSQMEVTIVHYTVHAGYVHQKYVHSKCVHSENVHSLHWIQWKVYTLNRAQLTSPTTTRSSETIEQSQYVQNIWILTETIPVNIHEKQTPVTIIDRRPGICPSQQHRVPSNKTGYRLRVHKPEPQSRLPNRVPAVTTEYMEKPNMG